MKLFILTLFITTLSYSQIDILNMSCVDSTKGVLFKGYQNKLIVTGLDSDSVLLVNVLSDTLKRWTNESPFIYGPRKGKNDTIRVIFKGVEVFRKGFDNEKIGNVVIQLGSLTDSIVLKEDLLNNLYLNLEMENSNFKMKASIFSFFARIEKNDGSEVDCNNEVMAKVDAMEPGECEDLECLTMQEERIYYLRNAFSPNQIQKISKMNSGDTLYIDKAYLVWPAGLLKAINPNLKFTIK